ncbi:MAG: septum formation initiator family protein [Caldiserica bacterium]|nr:septum formation initiator family protein [Caldisericota bacterium]MDH7562674.1 septum formation initiator family protein [Caldisericota bacterium]
MSKEKGRPKKMNNFRDLLILGLILALGFSLYQLYFRVEAYMEAENELARTQSEVLSLQKEEQENQRLLIQSDSESLMEKLAREQLGMVKEGETVYRLSDTLTSSLPSPVPTEVNFLERIYNFFSQIFSAILR